MAFNLPIQKTIVLKANLKDSVGNVIQAPVEWTIQSGTSVTITPAGSVTNKTGNPYCVSVKGITAGASTVRATWDNGVDTPVTADYVVTVYVPEVTTIEIGLA